MNVLPDEHIYPFMKESAPLLPENAIKSAHLVLQQIHRGYQQKWCEKCPNTEFFLVRIFLYSDRKKLRIWTLFTQWKKSRIFFNECEFHFQSLIDDGGLQMYSDKCCSIYFVVLTLMTCKCFFKSLCSWETHVSLFKKITVMNSTIFIYKPSLSWF